MSNMTKDRDNEQWMRTTWPEVLIVDLANAITDLTFLDVLPRGCRIYMRPYVHFLNSLDNFFFTFLGVCRSVCGGSSPSCPCHRPPEPRMASGRAESWRASEDTLLTGVPFF